MAVTRDEDEDDDAASLLPLFDHLAVHTPVPLLLSNILTVSLSTASCAVAKNSHSGLHAVSVRLLLLMLFPPRFPCLLPLAIFFFRFPISFFAKDEDVPSCRATAAAGWLTSFWRYARRKTARSAQAESSKKAQMLQQSCQDAKPRLAR